MRKADGDKVRGMYSPYSIPFATHYSHNYASIIQGYLHTCSGPLAKKCIVSPHSIVPLYIMAFRSYLQLQESN